jgi:hypothetical protein
VSILPSDNSISTIQQTTSNSTTTTDSTTLATYKEYAWDFDNDDFVIQDGDFVILTKNDALKVWIYKALKTSRYRYLAYSFYYGNEFESLIGQPFSADTTKSKLKSLTEQCLLVNKYIKSVDSVDVELDESTLVGSITVTTIYGQLEVNINDVL